MPCWNFATAESSPSPKRPTQNRQNSSRPRWTRIQRRNGDSIFLIEGAYSLSGGAKGFLSAARAPFPSDGPQPRSLFPHRLAHRPHAVLVLVGYVVRTSATRQTNRRIPER